MIPLLIITTGLTLTAWNIYYEWERYQKYREALAYARSVSKPLLNVGCGNYVRYIGDINIDKNDSVLPNFVKHDLSEALPFPDKYFGSTIAFHVLEHVDDPRFTLSELVRVSDRVYVTVPHELDLINRFHPDHKWVFTSYEAVPNNPIAFWVLAVGAGLLYVSQRRGK